MNPLTTDTSRTYELGTTNALPIAANTRIYEGAALGDNGDGYVRPLQAGDPFRGFADRHGDNTQGTEGERTIRIRKQGAIVLSLPGARLSDVGKAVYASDDNTFTLESAGNTFIGRIARLDSIDTVIVDFHVSLSVAHQP